MTVVSSVLSCDLFLLSCLVTVLSSVLSCDLFLLSCLVTVVSTVVSTVLSKETFVSRLESSLCMCVCVCVWIKDVVQLRLNNNGRH